MFQALQSLQIIVNKIMKLPISIEMISNRAKWIALMEHRNSAKSLHQAAVEAGWRSEVTQRVSATMIVGYDWRSQSLSQMSGLARSHNSGSFEWAEVKKGKARREKSTMQLEMWKQSWINF